MQDNKPTEYSLSRADESTGGRGVSASDLRIDPSAPTHKPNYATGKPADTLPNLTNLQAPPSVLRDMLREAEVLHRYKHDRRKKKLLLKLFWIFFAIYAVGVSLITLAGFESLSIGESLILVGASALMCIPFAAITAFIYRWIIITGYTRAFAGDAEEIQYIEHLKDCMCQSNEKGQA
jgi:hypothetical protein